MRQPGPSAARRVRSDIVFSIQRAAINRRDHPTLSRSSRPAGVVTVVIHARAKVVANSLSLRSPTRHNHQRGTNRKPSYTLTSIPLSLKTCLWAPSYLSDRTRARRPNTMRRDVPAPRPGWSRHSAARPRDRWSPIDSGPWPRLVF